MPTPPGAPEILASGKDFATIEWLKPESDGGSALVHYLVERRERKSARWVKVNRDGAHLDTTLKVCGLTEGNIYQFRVTAVNKAGESEASEVSLYVVCRVPTCKFELSRTSLSKHWQTKPLTDGDSMPVVPVFMSILLVPRENKDISRQIQLIAFGNSTGSSANVCD